MATVNGMYMLSRLYRVDRGDLESLMKGRRQLSRGKRRKFLMLLIVVAIIVKSFERSKPLGRTQD